MSFEPAKVWFTGWFLRFMAERIIEHNRSVIVAADVEVAKLSALVRETCLVEGIGGYKIGLSLALEEGLGKVVCTVKEHTGLPVIYDHQKAGNDIPAMGSVFAKVCKQSGVDAVILFPFAGEVTERDWIKACRDNGLGVLVGAHMTQPKFLLSEGGSIADEAPERIFTIAAEEGVSDFVVPGNKVELVGYYKKLIENILGKDNFTLYAPGFITQGGKISDFAVAAGNKWHAIVGSAIYKAVDMHKTAEQMTRQIWKD
ncbi:MAG: orotidine 5'-phosphate decarboxylase / HUMPS family protein [bacterium]|nr:orotidine 5'-phosphate decarboxylase / HUMPS family protein [bacterium]